MDLPTVVQRDLPNVEMICRASYQAELTQLSRQESALAIHRREQDLAAKRRTRMQAAAWRRSCKKKERWLRQRDNSLLMAQEASEELAEELEAAGSPHQEDGESPSRRSSASKRCSTPEGQRRSSRRSSRQSRRSSVRDAEGTRSVRKMSAGPTSPRGPSKEYSAVVKKTLASIKRSRPMIYPDAEELQEGEQEAFQLYGSKRSRELARRLAALPEEERNALRDIYGIYDINGDALLEKEELRHALFELGLVCLDSHERRALSHLCDKKSNGKVGCNFTEFAVDLVPAVRKALNTRRIGRLQKHIDACRRDWKGKLSVEQVLGAVERLLPLDMIEGNNENRLARLEEVRKHTVEFVQEEDIQSYWAKVMRVVEDQQRCVCARQRQIQAEHGVEEEVFQNMRYQLVYLESIFNHVDNDGNGELSADEVMDVFRFLGVAPKSQGEQRKIKAMMDQSTGADFGAFLDLVIRIREMYMSQPDETLLAAFLKLSAANHDGDKILEDKRITSEQLREMFEELGAVAPTEAGSITRQRDALAMVLQEADPEGWELFGYEEVKYILQRVKESIRQQAVQLEDEQIQACRFDEAELEDLRWAFDRLDDTSTGALSMDEVQQACDMLGVEFVQEIHFKVTYNAMDSNSTGGLEFLEFLKMMKMVRDKEGPLKSDTNGVSTLSNLDKSDMLLLLDCLGVRWEVMMDMTDKEMLERACDLLEVGPLVALWPACGCSCLRDLFKHARAITESRPSIG